MYQSFTQAYYALAEQVFERAEFESAPRGMKVKECLAVKFQIANPRDRLLYVPERKLSLCYLVAEIVWYCLGESSTEWISNYSDFWTNISDDGKTANSAYGARIFKQSPKTSAGKLTQWDYVVQELKRDPDSRRAVIHIRVPSDAEAKLDVPCTLTLHPFVRNDKLHMIANMRSSDMIFGLSYDVPAFTIIQELLALELGVELGTYTHVSNSLHVYEKHFDMCRKILAGKPSIYVTHPMPALKTFPPIHALDRIQSTARQACHLADNIRELMQTVEDLDLHDDVWRDWAKILMAHAAGKHAKNWVSHPMFGQELTSLKQELLQSTAFVGYHKFTG